MSTAEEDMSAYLEVQFSKSAAHRPKVSHAGDIQLWDDTVGDSGLSPTDEELGTFADAVREKERARIIHWLTHGWDTCGVACPSYVAGHTIAEFIRNREDV